MGPGQVRRVQQAVEALDEADYMQIHAALNGRKRRAFSFKAESS